MANKLYQESSIKDIADAIREKSGSSDTYTVGEMGDAVRSIDTSKDIPSYHYVESKRVSDKISQFKQNHPNSLCFGAVSDIHVLNNDTAHELPSKQAIDYASFALEAVSAMTNCDFIINLGDLCWENGMDTDNAYVGAKYSANALNSAFKRIPHYSIPGNHDKTDSTQKQYDLIGVNNTFDEYSFTRIRGYGYKDYEDQKVRVIALNTNDYLNASGGCAVSYEQKDFLMRSLDLSGKGTPSEWQILLFSHIPIDWNGGDYNYYADLQTILTAYSEGTIADIIVVSSYALHETPSDYKTYSNGHLAYDYSGKNAAKIIANIHGHVHNNRVSKIANTNIARIATVNTNPDLNKSESYPTYGDYSISSEEAAKLVKASGTAKDTALTFYCIDLDGQTIYAYGYGADVDRTIVYKDAKIYSIEYSISGVVLNNSQTEIAEGDAYLTAFTVNDGYVLSQAAVTMGGQDITSTCYDASSQTINIDNVTGEIEITIVAKAELWSYTVPDLASAARMMVNGVYSVGNSNDYCTIATSTQNEHSFEDRESHIRYWIPVPTKATKITVSTTDTKFERITLYGAKGTSKVIELKDQQFTTGYNYGFGQGMVDYILIGLAYPAAEKVAWGYDISQITVVFDNT